MLKVDRKEAQGIRQRPPTIVAVLVLYKMLMEESPAYQGLTRAMRESAVAAERIQLLVCDNGATRQMVPEDFSGTYIHDGGNPGLARRYNQALNVAKEAGAEWLLLLDQDTHLTAEFVNEVLELTDGSREADLLSPGNVVALVPKLVQRGAILSPHLPLSFEFSKPLAMDLEMYGVPQQRLSVYNSGALLRVRAVEAMGGFPEEFWLDYLDHATFRSLTAQGGELFVMRSALEHALSTNTAEREPTADSLQRERNILEAERKYYQKYGSVSEQLRFTLRRIRMMLLAVRERRLDRLTVLVKLSFFR